MADTQRTISGIEALLPDNTAVNLAIDVISFAI